MLELTGHIDDSGILQIPNRAELLQWVSEHKGKSIALSFKVNRRKRSNDQNAYYPKVRTAT